MKFVQFFKDGEYISLSEVDDYLCLKFGHTIDPEDWCLQWFDYEGKALIEGLSVQEIQQKWPERANIIAAISEEYEWRAGARPWCSSDN